MRRSFIILCIYLLILTNTVFASGYADVENTIYNDAVKNLIELCIYSQNSNGVFGVDEKITKAQMAKTLVYCVGLEDAARLKENELVYEDVSRNHWASGYISVISTLGYMVIDSDKKFYPEDYVTLDEAITYCVKMLGYGSIVDLDGSWPTNFKWKNNGM